MGCPHILHISVVTAWDNDKNHSNWLIGASIIACIYLIGNELNRTKMTCNVSYLCPTPQLREGKQTITVPTIH